MREKATNFNLNNLLKTITFLNKQNQKLNMPKKTAKKRQKVPKKLPELEPKTKKPSKVKTDYDIAYDFATKVYKQFQEAIKSIVLFGSAVKGETVVGSDIDILIVVDDCSIQWDQELIAWYREELAKITEKQEYAERIHVNTVTLSTFWEDVREGEPAAINIVRYGQPLIDFGGFFDPIKVLLAKGRIRPSPEAIFITLRRAPLHITRSKFDMTNSIEHLYWAMVDSAHAALMASNQIPPSPEHVPEMLDEIFVSKRLLEKKYVLWYKEMYELAHDIVHGTVRSMSGKDIDIVLARTIEFEKVMRNITSRLISNEKIIQVKNKNEPIPEPPKVEEKK